MNETYFEKIDIYIYILSLEQKYRQSEKSRKH